jgi:hypothetical protein
MVARRLVVTGSDRGYFAYARQCLLSLADEVRGADLAVLDFGLSDEQRRFCQSLGALVRRPSPIVPDDPPGRPGFYAWPQLPRLFPDHDALAWIDADTVMFDGGAVDDLFAASAGGALAVVPELHHAYHRYGCSEPRINALHLRTRRFGGPWLRGPLSYQPFQKLYGEAVAESLAFRPVLNSGFFALLRDSPAWEAWGEELAKTDGADPAFHAQAALNVTVALHDLPVETLSATNNWLTSFALPRVDLDRRVLVTPSPEHEPIRVVHFAGLAGDSALTFETRSGGRFETRPTELRERLRGRAPGAADRAEPGSSPAVGVRPRPSTEV